MFRCLYTNKLQLNVSFHRNEIFIEPPFILHHASLYASHFPSLSLEVISTVMFSIYPYIRIIVGDDTGTQLVMLLMYKHTPDDDDDVQERTLLETSLTMIDGSNCSCSMLRITAGSCT